MRRQGRARRLRSRPPLAIRRWCDRRPSKRLLLAHRRRRPVKIVKLIAHGELHPLRLLRLEQERRRPDQDRDGLREVRIAHTHAVDPRSVLAPEIAEHELIAVELQHRVELRDERRVELEVVERISPDAHGEAVERPLDGRAILGVRHPKAKPQRHDLRPYHRRAPRARDET